MPEVLEFNKIAIQEYRKKLAARRASLPTLKSKESVLRLTVQRLKDDIHQQEKNLEAKINEASRDIELWAEFPYNIFALDNLVTKPSRIAGVAVPDFDHMIWKEREFSRFNKPGWLNTGIGLLRDLATQAARLEITKRQLGVLEHARRKTTQKVNLYEKVQIPAYLTAIQSIKRYLEDVENLEKAAMKIVKQRLEKQAGAARAIAYAEDSAAGEATP